MEEIDDDEEKPPPASGEKDGIIDDIEASGTVTNNQNSNTVLAPIHANSATDIKKGEKATKQPEKRNASDDEGGYEEQEKAIKKKVRIARYFYARIP